MWRNISVRLQSLRFAGRLGTQGTATIELALVAPILLLLMAGGWDFGNMALQHERLENAARAGVAYGVQSTTAATDYNGMIQAARNDANDTAGSLGVTATQVCACPGGAAAACTATCPGNVPLWVYVQVGVTEPYTTQFPWPFLSNPTTLSSQVAMRVQ
jgi:Flp pilus assembly protein TadG